MLTARHGLWLALSYVYVWIESIPSTLYGSRSYFLELMSLSQPSRARLPRQPDRMKGIKAHGRTDRKSIFYFSPIHLAKVDTSTMAFRWVYQQGNYWAPFDDRTNLTIEMLYRNGTSKTVHVAHLGAVFVNPVLSYMLLNGNQFLIMRTGS